jgi:hypothetical protein
MLPKSKLPPDSHQFQFDRSVEITLNHLAAAREIAIKLSSGHEPNPSLVAGLVQAMATNYLAEMTGTVPPASNKDPMFQPLATQKLRVDFDTMATWPALNEISKRT